MPWGGGGDRQRDIGVTVPRGCVGGTKRYWGHNAMGWGGTKEHSATGREDRGTWGTQCHRVGGQRDSEVTVLWGGFRVTPTSSRGRPYGGGVALCWELSHSLQVNNGYFPQSQSPQIGSQLGINNHPLLQSQISQISD